MVIGLFCVFTWPTLVSADVLPTSVDLSTLAISEEQGGANTQAPVSVDVPENNGGGGGGSNQSQNTDPVNSGEGSFNTDSTGNSGEGSFNTSDSSLAISGEGNFTTGIGSADEVSPENQFTTNNGGGGGGGGNNDDNGGGGGGGGGRRRTPAKPVTPELPQSCPRYLNEFIKLGRANNPLEVIKLQYFLRTYEGYEVPLNGVYDETTYQAVKLFQLRYGNDVLTPWGINEPTGYVFITTQLAINNIYCDRSTSNSLDLRGIYKRGVESGTAPVIKPSDLNLGTSTPDFIGPMPEGPHDVGQKESLWQVAAIGLANFWQDSCGWLNILLAILAIIFFILWVSERNKRDDANRAPPGEESLPDDYDGPQLFSS